MRFKSLTFLLALMCIGALSFSQSTTFQDLDVRRNAQIPRYSSLPASGKVGSLIYVYTGIDSGVYIRRSSAAGGGWMKVNQAVGAGSGTVTSVSIGMPDEWTVIGNPITAGGVISISKNAVGPRSYYAGPDGAFAGPPSFRNIVADDLPTVPVSKGGTGAVTANAGLNALLPTQTGQAGKVLSTDGSNTSWIVAAAAGGGITSVRQTTAPADTTKFWIDNNAANDQVDIVKVWLRGGWRAIGYHDLIANHYSEKPPLYVLGTGQSNAAENPVTGGIPLGDLSTDSRVLRWNGSAWAMANISPLNNLTFQFAKLIAKTENRTVRYINSAGPGIPAAQWLVGGSQYTAIESAITAAGVDSIDVILFRQGEADNTMTEKQYANAFYNVINTWRSRPWFNSLRPIVAGGLKIDGSSLNQADYGVQQFYDKLAYDNTSSVIYASNDGIFLPLNDIHIYGVAVDSSARRMFDAYKAGRVSGPRPSIMVNRSNAAVGTYNIYTYPSRFLDTGSLNVALGYEVMIGGAGGKTQNVGIGYRALRDGTGGFNVAIGTNAGTGAGTGANNVYVGTQAGLNSTSNFNTIINGGRTGSMAGGGNTAVGYTALNNNTGGNVVALGNAAAFANGSGNGGVAVGTIAAQNMANQANYVAVGTAAMQNNSNGVGDIGIGYGALQNNTGNNYEIGLGFEAGKNNSFNNIIAIGRLAQPDAANQVAIMNGAGPGNEYLTFKLQNIKLATGTTPVSGDDGKVMKYVHANGTISLQNDATAFTTVTGTTTNSTPLNISTITIPDNTTGRIELDVSGTTFGGNVIGGKVTVTYKKVAGALTLFTVQTVGTVDKDAAVTAASFTMVSSSNNVAVQVTGITGDINWQGVYRITSLAIPV